LRIGVHTDPVISGIVGNRRMTFRTPAKVF